MDLSIIIPSLRNGFFNQLMRSIEKHTKGIEYEVLENHEVGNLYRIISKEFTRAKGKYVFLTCDEAIVHEGWAANMISFLDKKPIMTMGNLSFITDDRGSTRPMDIRYYDLECSIHPFCKREAIKGDFFDPRFNRFYGDIDLSLRFWAAGGTVETCPTSCITMFNNRDKIKRDALKDHLQPDEIEFKKKWDGYDFNLCSNSEKIRMFQTSLCHCPIPS